MRLLNVVHTPNFDFNELAEIITSDVAISYKLLKFINSSYFGLPNEVATIRLALTLLGIKEIRKWISMLLLTGLGRDKPEELVFLTTIRAKICELIGEKLRMKNRMDDLFLMGLFSKMDSLLGRQMDEILQELPIADESIAALLVEQNRFRDVFEIALGYENGDWEHVDKYATKLSLDQQNLPKSYETALAWTRKIFGVK